MVSIPRAFEASSSDQLLAEARDADHSAFGTAARSPRAAKVGPILPATPRIMMSPSVAQIIGQRAGSAAPCNSSSAASSLSTVVGREAIARQQQRSSFLVVFLVMTSILQPDVLDHNQMLQAEHQQIQQNAEQGHAESRP
jgi:hypothetical protein